jgi:hypothetical protein
MTGRGLQATWDATWASAYGCTEPVPFDGAFLDAISHAKAEPIVARRAWVLRVMFGAVGVAYVGHQLSRRLLHV